MRNIVPGSGFGNAQLMRVRRARRSAWTLLVSLGLALTVLLGSAVAPPSRPARAEVQMGGQVGVGLSPLRVAANPVTNRIYVTNRSGNSVSVIDGATNVKLGDIPLGAGTAPRGIAVDAVNNKIYVANSGNGTYAVIDGTTALPSGPSATITIGAGSTPEGIAVNPNKQKLYVTALNSSSLLGIRNTADNSVVALPFVGMGAGAVAVNTANDKVYVANSSAHTVTVIDGTSNLVVGDAITVPGDPSDVAVNPATNRVYVASDNTTDMKVIDSSNDQIVGSISTASNGVAVNPNANRIYVTRSGDDSVAVIDGRTNTLVGNPILLNGGESPAGVAVNPVACGPRPSVTLTTAVANGALQATVTASSNGNAPNNRLISLNFGAFLNATVVHNGLPIAANQTVPLGPNTTTTTFTVDRASQPPPGQLPQPTTVNLNAVDTCGSWPLFVGGGPNAGF